MKYIFIINPTAGKGNLQLKIENKIIEYAEENGTDCEIYHTTGTGDACVFAHRTAQESNGAPIRFFACGGDGTLNEVANGIVGISNAELGLIPVGTGNDFISNFTCTEKFFDIEAQINGSPVYIDAIKTGDCYSVNMINMGFDCAVVERVAKLKTNSLISSQFAYIAGVLVTLIKKPTLKIKSIKIDGRSFAEKNLLLCTIGNGGFCGGGFHSAPTACLDDGVMETVVARNMTRLQFISMVDGYKKGTYIHNARTMKKLSYIKCRKMEIEFSEVQNICIDGETQPGKAISAEICRGVFRFSLPMGVSMKIKSPERETATAH